MNTITRISHPYFYKVVVQIQLGYLFHVDLVRLLRFRQYHVGRPPRLLLDLLVLHQGQAEVVEDVVRAGYVRGLEGGELVVEDQKGGGEESEKG